MDFLYQQHWERHRETIRERLRQFQEVPQEEYLFELLYCLLTPQSKAANAEQVIARLRSEGFPEQMVDPVPLLRDPAHYIRFHNQKGRRILLVWERWDEIFEVIASNRSSSDKREWLVENVNGLGWKEASHFLRNIGHLDLAIIDRHILKHLLRSGAIDQIPKTISKKTYVELEQKFVRLASSHGLELQELDLLFWSLEEGSVRK
ncbi:MAG: DNA lyase [Candidatus Kapaibacterium sp.]